MAGWLKSLFSRPQPSGPPQVVRRFEAGDPVLTQDVTLTAWGELVIEAVGPQVYRLYEVSDPEVEACLLTYRARLRSESLEGRAYLEMWCRLPGRGEFFSRGLNQPLKGTNDWGEFEIPFYLKKGERPDLIKLNLAVEGMGKIWVKDVELLRADL